MTMQALRVWFMMEMLRFVKEWIAVIMKCHDSIVSGK